MKHPRQPGSEDFAPLAAGLSDEDIARLLALVRTITTERILEIQSRHEDAEIRTGYLADGECGSGHVFDCIRTGSGWTLKGTMEWIS